MKHTIWSIEDIALSLYAYMELHEEFDSFVTDRYKKDINETLLQINAIIEETCDFPKAENLFTLIFNFGEMKSKSSFIDGFRSGTSINQINR